MVECRTPEREVRGSRPTAAVLCPWARHFTPRKYWLITQEAMAPSRHDWKIVDWDVKPQHNQPTTILFIVCLIKDVLFHGRNMVRLWWWRPLNNVKVLTYGEHLITRSIFNDKVAYGIHHNTHFLTIKWDNNYSIMYFWAMCSQISWCVCFTKDGTRTIMTFFWLQKLMSYFCGTCHLSFSRVKNGL